MSPRCLPLLALTTVMTDKAEVTSDFLIPHNVIATSQQMAPEFLSDTSMESIPIAYCKRKKKKKNLIAWEIAFWFVKALRSAVPGNGGD